jgi:hypothetical protein
VKAGSTAGGYGHTDNDWSSGITTTSGVACHYSAGDVDEIVDARNQGVTIQHHTLWMKYSSAPATLLVPGANVNHRITTIETSAGVSVDAGPFDITEITDMAGLHQLLRLVLKRIS